MLRDSRKIKGMEIAASTKLRRRGSTWFVPSKSKKGHFHSTDLKSLTCSCPDFETNKKKCKHLYAVEFIARREKPIHPKKAPKRPTYSQYWSAYNLAQNHEKEKAMELLKELCNGVVQPEQRMGRPRMSLGDMAFSVTMKVFGTMSGRRTASDLRDYAGKSLIHKAPHHATIFKYLEDEALTPVLQYLIAESAIPLKGLEENFAIDSTGFSTSAYARWYDEKYGKMANQKEWLKLHVLTGVKTNVVVSAEVTEAYVHDSTQFEKILKRAADKFTIKKVMADKAYLSRENLELSVKHGISPYIPFKSNTTGDGSPTWKKMYHLFQYRRREFLKNYHQRSNVESAIWMIKAKFGSSLRSKSWTATKNETLAKVLCHNLAVLVQSMYEFGIEGEFRQQA